MIFSHIKVTINQGKREKIQIHVITSECCQVLEKYGRVLRKFNKREEKFYEINDATVSSDICWMRMRSEISSSSEAVMEFEL